MKLINRQPVEGTERPTIYIGHRVYRGEKSGKRKTSRRWSAEWFLDGKQDGQSLGTNNKVAAIRAAHEVHRRIRQGEPTAAPREVRIKELVDGYMTLQRGQPRSPKTLEKYQKVLDDFAAHCENSGVVYGSRLTEEEFWSFEMERKLSDKTRYDRRVIILQLTKWATERAEVLSKNPLRHVEMKKPEWAPQPCFTPEQVECMLECVGPGMRDMIMVLAYTGIRFGELRELCWDDIDLKRGTHGFVTIQRGGAAGRTKGNRTRRIPLHPELAATLRSRPRTGDRLFTARELGGRGDGLIVGTVFLRKLKQLCATCKFTKPDQYKIHTFRHFFASMLARENVSYKYALEFMGHRSSDILDLYYKMYDKDAERAILAIQLRKARKPAA